MPEGEPWFGYRQFCMQFLYPLMLQSYRGVPYRPLLRGELDGISPEQMRNLISLRDVFAGGAHQRRPARPTRTSPLAARAARAELKRAGFKPELIKANVDRLARLVRRRMEAGPIGWSDYRELDLR